MLRGNPTQLFFSSLLQQGYERNLLAWLNKDFRWLTKENAGLSFIIPSFPPTPAILQEQFGWVVSWPAMNMAPKAA
jgi:hypothetical protein